MVVKNQSKREISNRLFYTLVVISVLVGVGFGVYAKTGTLTPTGAEIWVPSGNNIYYNNGNVGVGVQSPSEKLTVNGNVKFGTGAQVAIRHVVGSSCPSGTIEIARKWAPKTCSNSISGCGNSSSLGGLLGNVNCSALSCTTAPLWSNSAPTCSSSALTNCKADKVSEVVCVGN